MNLEEAIEIITKEAKGYHPDFSGRTIAALNLGIEALKAWKQFREGRWVSGRYDLPGETKS